MGGLAQPSRLGDSAVDAGHALARGGSRSQRQNHQFVRAPPAHIHSGTTGRSGPVLVALSSGPKLHHRGCLAISPTVSRAIWKQPSAYYVNVHSFQYPGGAVRAQL
jgi:hypothetical protein